MIRAFQTDKPQNEEISFEHRLLQDCPLHTRNADIPPEDGACSRGAAHFISAARQFRVTVSDDASLGVSLMMRKRLPSRWRRRSCGASCSTRRGGG